MDNQQLLMFGGALFAFVFALKKLRDTRETLILFLWESETYRQKLNNFIENNAKVMALEGRIKELSRAQNHPDESSFDWGEK